MAARSVDWTVLVGLSAVLALRLWLGNLIAMPLYVRQSLLDHACLHDSLLYIGQCEPFFGVIRDPPHETYKANAHI